jgi:hypothetical protein
MHEATLSLRAVALHGIAAPPIGCTRPTFDTQE